MERILRNLEFKENRCSRTKKLWDDFCKSENSETTLIDTISISSKPLHPILKNKMSTESIRTLSVTEIDALISRANENHKRLYEEVQAIKRSLIKPFQPDKILVDETTPLQSPKTRTIKDSDLYLSLDNISVRSKTSESIQAGKDSNLNLNLGSISARSKTSAKSENLSEFQFSHRSSVSNHHQPDDIHMYKLVIEDSNSSISHDRSTVRSVPTPRNHKPKQQRTVKSAQPKKSPSKYNLLSAKEHLEMQRILGIENLLERGSNTDRPRLYSPDLEHIESALNINDIETVSYFTFTYI